MKKIILYTFLIASFTGCKKAIESIQEDLIVKALTDGQWAVTSFTLNNADITADFAGYRFKYYSNKTVDAIKNGVLEKTGTYDGNASARTTSANFPSATYPLTLINGTWNIVDNSFTFVIATQTSGGNSKTLRLDKQ